MSDAKKIVIVGGVAGGASAAARLRRLNEKAEIVMFERTGFISYANCGLPYYIGKIITKESELTLQTPESFGVRFNIDVRIYHEVISVNAENKTVTVKNLKTGEIWEEPYDKLVLSPGARPFVPDIFGANDEKVFALRTVEDTTNICSYIDSANPESAVVSGAGFIGLEMAENLKNRGIDVTLVARSEQVLSRVDGEIASFIHAELRRAGIKLILGRSVVSVQNKGASLEITMSDGNVFNYDMAIIASGVIPESSLAKTAGLSLGMRDSIVVDEHMRTSNSDIYAVGDVVQVKHAVSGNDAVISLAGPANKQGRIAADNITGAESSYRGAFGSSVIKIFDSTVAFTGLSEKAAKVTGMNYDKIFLSPPNHASYYPGSRVMTMKVIFDPGNDRILGAQIFGGDGVDKQIDIIATAIFAGLPASRLKDLDLSYAPPYSSAKSPVNMAGFMMDNIMNGIVKQFFYENIADIPKDGSVNMLDVRTAGEYSNGHVEGFINIPVDELRNRINEIDKGKVTYVMCQSAIRSYIACRILMQNGFDCYNFSGGYRLYKSIVTEKAAALQSLPCGADK